MTNKYFKSFGVAMVGLPTIAMAQERPNIVVILADDLGFSDIGCYGGEIETPNLNYLAENGLRYKQFYNSARSCPSRASLMTGLYPHQAGMGWMANANLGTPNYQGYINKESVTIAEVLKTAGYSTYMSGKWHISSDRQNNGKIKDNWPNQRGFDHFYGIVAGATNYWHATVNYDNEQVDTKDDSDFYFTHTITDNAVSFVGEHNYKEQPLFLYLAYTAPHWPLHALKKDIDKYVERYKAGWDKLRIERFQRQKSMGLFSEDTQLTPRDQAVSEWNKFSDSEKEEYVMRMAIYAAQVDAMDQGIGKIINTLKKKGQLDNTIIMFMSDNGACAEFISNGKNKVLDGNIDSYESYRRNWANLSSTPYYQYKHYTYEGGIASPLVVYYPKGISKELTNTFVDEYGHFTDIMATCVDLSKAAYPKQYKENRIIPMQGQSLAPNFKGEKTDREYTFWEHEANIAMRDGRWKMVCKTDEGDQFNEKAIKLYDLENDPTEMNDLSETHSQKLNTMYALWKNWAKDIGVYPLDTRDYGERARAFKRNHINGEFDDNFGDWGIVVNDNADVNFSIDTINTISGKKTARIGIKQKGLNPNSAHLKWVFATETENCRAKISFKGLADKQSIVDFRLEMIGSTDKKPLNEDVTLTEEINTFNFDNIQLSQKGRYQLIFNLGTTRENSTIWIDDVKLEIE